MVVYVIYPCTRVPMFSRPRKVVSATERHLLRCEAGCHLNAADGVGTMLPQYVHTCMARAAGDGHERDCGVRPLEGRCLQHDAGLQLRCRGSRGLRSGSDAPV